MEIIDQAVSKAREAWDVVSKKTGEVVTAGKRKYDISALQVKLSKDFERLGKLYYDLIKEEGSDDEEVSAILEDIREKTEKIKELKAKLNAAKNKRICPNCGAAIEENSIYCNFCGAELVFDTQAKE